MKIKNKKTCHINNIDPFLTSAVHHFPDVSGGHDVVGAQVISNLPSDGHDDSHHKVRKSRKYSYLEERKNKHLHSRPETSCGQWPSEHTQDATPVCYLANLEAKHLLKVCRLADEKQIESPASAEIRHDDGVNRHGRKEGPPWRVEFLQQRSVLLLQTLCNLLLIII